jgi:hypothetical protein
VGDDRSEGFGSFFFFPSSGVLSVCAQDSVCLVSACVVTLVVALLSLVVVINV